jgi:hypothetical protein
MTYKYKNPTSDGFEQVYLSRKKHNELFVNRKLNWYQCCEYYRKDNHIIIHRFINPIGITIETMLLPLSLVWNGVGNANQLWKEYKQLVNQKKYGSFSGDDVWSGYMEGGVFIPNEFFTKLNESFNIK